MKEVRVKMVKWGSYTLAILAAVLSVASPVVAGSIPRTPEIDGSSMSAGFGLLAAGILLLRARRTR
jgi:MYXO-CTERM domain-containing protein